MAFESGAVPFDLRSAVKGKGDKTKYRNYRGIKLSVVGKIYVGILIDRVTKGVSEQGGV